MRKRFNKKSNYAFIDSQNLNLSVQNDGWKMHWAKFRTFLKEQYNVEKAFMFIGYMPEFEDMYAQLHEAGYSIVLKQTYDLTKPQPELLKEKELKTLELDKPKDDQEKHHIKGNVDTDVVLWAMKEMPNYKQAVLVSGDGDFYSLVEHLVGHKKLKKILTPTGHYSNLFNKYEKYIDRLDKHRKELEYPRHKKRRKKT